MSLKRVVSSSDFTRTSVAEKWWETYICALVVLKPEPKSSHKSMTRTPVVKYLENAGFYYIGNRLLYEYFR